MCADITITALVHACWLCGTALYKRWALKRFMRKMLPVTLKSMLLMELRKTSHGSGPQAPQLELGPTPTGP